MEAIMTLLAMLLVFLLTAYITAVVFPVTFIQAAVGIFVARYCLSAASN